MTQDLQSLLNLPLATLVTLAGGYIGYHIAYVGKKDQHRTIDTLFIVLVFGLVTRGVFEGVINYGVDRFKSSTETVAVAISILLVILASGLWRRFNGKITRYLINPISGSRHDGHKTAWQSILATEGAQTSQIEVYLKCGTVLLCDHTYKFNKTKYGPMFLGYDGSMALYVTDIKTPLGKYETVEEVSSNDWGDQITYIPAEEISRIALRTLRE